MFEQYIAACIGLILLCWMVAGLFRQGRYDYLFLIAVMIAGVYIIARV